MKCTNTEARLKPRKQASHLGTVTDSTLEGAPDIVPAHGALLEHLEDLVNDCNEILRPKPIVSIEIMGSRKTLQFAASDYISEPQDQTMWTCACEDPILFEYSP